MTSNDQNYEIKSMIQWKKYYEYEFHYDDVLISNMQMFSYKIIHLQPRSI